MANNASITRRGFVGAAIIGGTAAAFCAAGPTARTALADDKPEQDESHSLTTGEQSAERPHDGFSCQHRQLRRLRVLRARLSPCERHRRKRTEPQANPDCETYNAQYLYQHLMHALPKPIVHGRMPRWRNFEARARRHRRC